jgi:hypothetical protein
MSVVAAFLAVLWLTDNDRDSVVLIASAYGLQSEVFAMVAWVHRRSRLRADPTGLHWDTGLRTRTYPWEDITEIRPSIARGKRTFLVLVRGNHEVVDLPVTEEHLDELRRWHAAQG